MNSLGRTFLLALVLNVGLAGSVPGEPTSKQAVLGTVEVVYGEQGHQRQRVRKRVQPEMHFGLLEDVFLQPLTLSLQPVSGWKGGLRIFQRAQSSFTVGREGPHLDLLNWKHGYSEWVALKQTKPFQFAVVKIPTPRLPPYTAQELKAAVLSELKTWRESDPSERAAWLEASSECAKRAADACIGTSQNSFRVEAKVEGRWVAISTIHVEAALGC